MRILGPLPLARARLGAAESPAAPAQAAHPLKNRRRLIPWMGQLRGVSGWSAVRFIFFSFPAICSLPSCRIYLQPPGDVKKRGAQLRKVGLSSRAPDSDQPQ